MKQLSIIALLVVASALVFSQAKNKNKSEKQSHDEIEQTLLKMENEWA